MSAGAAIPNDPARAYVEARAAALAGDHARSAALLAALAQSQPGQADIARRALLEALGSGQMDLALSVASKLPSAQLPTEARLLLVSDAVRHRRTDQAISWLQAKGEGADLSFLVPLLAAWTAAERGDANGAVGSIDDIPNNSLLASLRDEEHALILLKFKRTAEAEPFARRAIGAANTRENQVRLALADGFLAAGDRDRALIMIDGMGSDAAAARQRVMAGRQSGQRIDTAAEALSEALTAFATDVARLQRGTPPIALAQVARYADPQNSAATALVALLLAQQNRDDEALALLASVPRDDALISQVRDVQVKILTDSKRLNEAYAIASAAANGPAATISDFSRLGDVLQAMKRNSDAAQVYGRGVALATSQGLKQAAWPLLLLQANALEEAGRWPEVKAAMQQALALSPDQPLLLNFLGYSKLEHHEDLDNAEAMIRKANQLAPDDASITDSLGWALFKRGKVDEAITILQTAAEKDPQEADIQEHLGDALFRAGRRYEARFAWNAALVTGDGDLTKRVTAKLATGLTTANAAP